MNSRNGANLEARGVIPLRSSVTSPGTPTFRCTSRSVSHAAAGAARRIGEPVSAACRSANGTLMNTIAGLGSRLAGRSRSRARLALAMPCSDNRLRLSPDGLGRARADPRLPVGRCVVVPIGGESDQSAPVGSHLEEVEGTVAPAGEQDPPAVR